MRGGRGFVALHEKELCCNGSCVFPLYDDKNCGGCGNACPSGVSCKGDGGIGCGPSTLDGASSTSSSGVAGVVCTSDADCYPDPHDLALCCGGFCSFIYSDPKNCGACGKACAEGLSCSGSTCSL